MRKKYEVDVVCESGHTTTTWVTPLERENGIVTRGIMGSSADFCDVCDALIAQVGVVREVAQ